MVLQRYTQEFNLINLKAIYREDYLHQSIIWVLARVLIEECYIHWKSVGHENLVGNGLTNHDRMKFRELKENIDSLMNTADRKYCESMLESLLKNSALAYFQEPVDPAPNPSNINWICRIS